MYDNSKIEFNAAPVPEASTIISLSLLLALGWADWRSVCGGAPFMA